jgi:hypothetical protein
VLVSSIEEDYVIVLSSECVGKVEHGMVRR